MLGDKRRTITAVAILVSSVWHPRHPATCSSCCLHLITRPPSSFCASSCKDQSHAIRAKLIWCGPIASTKTYFHLRSHVQESVIRTSACVVGGNNSVCSSPPSALFTRFMSFPLAKCIHPIPTFSEALTHSSITLIQNLN